MITEVESNEKFELTKYSTKKFDWKIKNFTRNVIYSGSVKLPGELKLMLELRQNQKITSQFNGYKILPFYRFEVPKAFESVVRVSVGYNGSENLFSDFVRPSPNFCEIRDQGSLWERDYAFYIAGGCLTLSIEIEIQTKYPSSFLVLSDFTYTVGEKVFPVHKTILAARSPVFRKMFCEDHKNCKEATINDISPEGFDDFLRFIYVGEVKLLERNARELLMIADKYELDDLKTLCETHLLTTLTKQDAVELFQIAHKFRCSIDLKKAAFNRIKSIFAKLNIVLPDEFLEAPQAVSNAIMMKASFEDAIKVEIAQSEKVISMNYE